MRPVRSMLAGGDVRRPTPVFIRGDGPLFPDEAKAEQVARVSETERACPFGVSPFAFLWTCDPARAFALVIQDVVSTGGTPVVDGIGILGRLLALGHSHDEARAFVSRVLEVMAGLRSRNEHEFCGEEDVVLRASARLFLGLPMEQVATCRDHYRAVTAGRGL